MNLPSLKTANVAGKRVLLRMDLDVDEDFTRLELAGETLRYLIEKGCKIIILGHKGRPEGKEVEKLSLEYLIKPLEKITGKNIYTFLSYPWFGEIVKGASEGMMPGEIYLVENLRFDSREEANDPEFVRMLASVGDFYVNEAFAVAHRDHASITGLPKVLPHAAGFRFEKEVTVLSDVWENPKRPIVAVISGVKTDKLERIGSILDIVDKVLIGGRLPIYLDQEMPQNQNEEFSPEVLAAIPKILADSKVVIGKLTPDTEDITLHTVEDFKEELGKAATIILAGVPGKYEDEGHRQGTKEVFDAIANSSAFKIAGGGDAEAAITLLGLNSKFDWISVGGGAMLEFLAKRTLPGIEALK